MRQGRDAEGVEGEECGDGVCMGIKRRIAPPCSVVRGGAPAKEIFCAFEACKMSHLVMLNVTFVAHAWSFSEQVNC